MLGVLVQSRDPSLVIGKAADVIDHRAKQEQVSGSALAEVDLVGNSAEKVDHHEHYQGQGQHPAAKPSR